MNQLIIDIKTLKAQDREPGEQGTKESWRNDTAWFPNWRHILDHSEVMGIPRTLPSHWVQVHKKQ